MTPMTRNVLVTIYHPQHLPEHPRRSRQQPAAEEEIITVCKIADFTTGLLHQQDASGHVPSRQAVLKERIEAAAGHVGKVNRRSPVALLFLSARQTYRAHGRIHLARIINKPLN